MKHIDYAIPAKGHPPMHIMHKFWARKPHNVVAEYIHRYSNPGDVVLDPFAGSGVTAAEALHLGRKAVALDIDPIATFIARCTLVPVDVDRLKETFDELEQECRELISELYVTKCKDCGRASPTIATIWKLGNTYPSELRYECESCGRASKQLDSQDKALLRKIEGMDIPFWHPTRKLAYGDVEFKEGTHIAEIDSIDTLFTKRNLYSLALLYDRIGEIDDDLIRDLMKFAFSSMSHLASRMCPDRPTRPYSSFWPVHRYWIPERSMESNVWMLFESAVNGRQGLVKGKADSQKWYDGNENYVVVGEDGSRGIRTASTAELEKIIKECPVSEWKEAKGFSNLRTATALIQTSSVLDLINRQFPSKSIIPPESIDYCFTDPPYGGEIQYYELSQLWLSWLRGQGDDKRFNVDWHDEITINTEQGKGFDEYDAAMHAAFRQVFEVMKPDKYLTVTFHNTDIRIRNSLIRSVVYSGFDLDKIVHQTPARASAKSLLQPYGSAVGDYYLRFKKKPSSVKIRTPEEADKATQERIVIDSVIKILAERGEPTSYPWILNTIDTELVNRGYNLLRNPRRIEDILKAHLGSEFILVDVVNPKGQAEKKWWLKEPGKIAYLDRIPLNERVEVAVVDVLRRRYVVSFDDVLREIFIKFPNSLTPETHGVKNVLEQYANQVSGGRWQLKGSVKERENQHQEMIEILAGLGKRFGFDKVWAAHKSKDIEDIIEKSLELPMNRQRARRVKEIDVLWINGDRVEYAFEVENTTAITEAINRGSNIDYGCSRIIVLPEEREEFAYRKLKEPMLAENWFKYGWGFLFYDQIREMARRRTTNLGSIAKKVIRKTGRLKKPKQNLLL